MSIEYIKIEVPSQFKRLIKDGIKGIVKDKNMSFYSGGNYLFYALDILENKHVKHKNGFGLITNNRAIIFYSQERGQELLMVYNALSESLSDTSIDLFEYAKALML